MPLHLAGLGVGDPFAVGELGAARADASRLVGELGLALDVDAPAGEAGGETGVLALLADRQRQLVVGHDDLGGAGVLVDAHFLDLGRAEGLGHEIGGVVRERDDVDLLAAQLVDDHAHARTAGADAGPDRIDVVVVRPDGDLRAVAGFPGAGLDLDDAVGDLGDFQLEQALDQTGVCARDDDLRTLGRLAHLDDVRLQAGVRLRALVGNLLRLRQQSLDAAEVEQRVAAVGLLDDAGDDVTLAVRVLLELAIALSLADALVHHLAERLRGDAPQLVLGRRVVATIDPVALVVDVVGDEADLHRVRVDLDLDLVGGVRAALVGRHERVGQRLQKGVDRDALLGGEHPYGFGHVDVLSHSYVASSFGSSSAPGAALLSTRPRALVVFAVGDGALMVRARSRWAAPGLGCPPHSNKVFARSTSV